MNKYELKPCPFCGGHPCAEVAYPQKEFRIYCTGVDPCCCAEMRLSFEDAGYGNGNHMTFYEIAKVMDELTELWNARYVDDGNEED